MEKPLLRTIPETCFRLGIGRTKVYELIRGADLQLVKIGSKSLITEQSIEALVAKISGRQS